MKNNIAVIGAGVTGLGAALSLAETANVTVFETENRLGGHAVTVQTPRGTHVDMGFIVCNPRNYPNFLPLLDWLGVQHTASDMSLSVKIKNADWLGDLEYACDKPFKFFAQKRNMLRPAHWRMLRGIMRYFALATQALDVGDLPDNLTLGAWADAVGLPLALSQRFLAPMGAAIWSTREADIWHYPAKSILSFYRHHGLLSMNDQPQWRTVAGGSKNYVAALKTRLPHVQWRTGEAVTAIESLPHGVRVQTADSDTVFDKVILACHSDQALALWRNAPSAMRGVLSAIPYSANRVVLHGDTRVMPRKKCLWAAWNYHGDAAASGARLTYWMNRLQNIDMREPLFVTVNPESELNAVLHEKILHHPQFTQQTLIAQRALAAHQGTDNVYVCGAWTGYGFHEDGLSSGGSIGLHLGGSWPLEFVSTFASRNTINR